MTGTAKRIYKSKKSILTPEPNYAVIWRIGNSRQITFKGINYMKGKRDLFIVFAVVALTIFFSTVLSSYGRDRCTQNNIKFLTSESGVVDYWPRFSSDGALVLFTRNSGSEICPSDVKCSLYTVPVNGGSATLFLELQGFSATRANWSWDTDRIAFTGVMDSEPTLWIVNGDGSDPHQVSDQSGLAYPSWYPGGDSVAVTAAAKDGNHVLKQIDIETGESVRQLTSSNQVYAGEPAVSPDGKMIAFAGQRKLCDYTEPLTCQHYSDLYNQIWVENTEEGNHDLHQLDPEQGRTPDWSPDGMWIAFESARGCVNGEYAIFVEAAGTTAPSGGKAVQITDCKYDGNHGVWSPDGKVIAFSAVLSDDEPGRGIALVRVPNLSRCGR